MQTITLQIKDEKVDKFSKDKKKLEQTLQDIEDGKAILYTQEEFQNKMNYFMNDLRNKYANN